MRQLPRNAAELELMAGLRPTARRGVTQKDVAHLTRKRLGRLWGRKRRPRSC